MRDGSDRWPEAAWIATLLGTLAAALFADYFVVWTIGKPVRAMNGMQVALTLACREAAALIALVLLAQRYLQISPASLGLRAPRARESIVAVGAAIALYPVGSLAQYFFPRGDQWLDHALFFSNTAGRVALLLTVGIFSPIVQEIVFRGLLFKGLAQRLSSVVAFGGSALIFSLAHASSGLGTIVFTFIFGLAASGLFVTFRSLTAPIILHVVFNTGLTLLILRSIHAL